MEKIARIFIATLLFSVLSFADEYVVISNKNMKDLSPSQIRAIFLKKLVLVGDIKAVPVNLEARDPLRLKFEQDILDMSFERLKSYWTKQHYLGHRPPVSMKSQESIKAFVKKVDGSLGYISADNVDNSVKVMYRWSD